MYNKTQLYPEVAFERHIFHRDMFAHYLRWSHVLKIAPKSNGNILDLGCGNSNLLEVLYRNKYSPNCYVGIDVRKKTIDGNYLKWSKLGFAHFICADLCSIETPKLVKDVFKDTVFDIICCFEVVEHLGRDNIDNFLINTLQYMNNNTILLLSTPNFNGKDCANNHIIDGEIGEFTHNELKTILEKYFKITNIYGTFISLPDIPKDVQSLDIYKKLHEYYDNNILSCFYAPMFPELSRNIMWQLKLKEEIKNGN